MINLITNENDIIFKDLARANLNIVDVSNTYPSIPRKKHPKPWNFRPEKFINRVVIHQTFCSNKEYTFLDIAKRHIEKGTHLVPTGTQSISHHYGINPNGQVLQFMKHTTYGVTIGMRDSVALSVAVLGDFSGVTYTGIDRNPTLVQMQGLARLLYKLTTSFIPRIRYDAIYGHEEFGRENCPGSRLMDFIEDWKTYIKHNEHYKNLKPNE